MYFLNVCCHSRIYRAHGIKACTTINAVLLHTTALHNACGLILESPKLSENEIEKMIVQSARQHLPILKQVGFVMHTLKAILIIILLPCNHALAIPPSPIPALFVSTCLCMLSQFPSPYSCCPIN
jgi:hypothetical protein